VDRGSPASQGAFIRNFLCGSTRDVSTTLALLPTPLRSCLRVPPPTVFGVCDLCLLENCLLSSLAYHRSPRVSVHYLLCLLYALVSTCSYAFLYALVSACSFRNIYVIFCFVLPMTAAASLRLIDVFNPFPPHGNVPQPVHWRSCCGYFHSDG
jgi:hypothetical protein